MTHGFWCWRVFAGMQKASLVLNASRRFRYTAKLPSHGAGEEGPSSPLVERVQSSRQNMTPAQRFRSSGHALMVRLLRWAGLAAVQSQAWLAG